MIRFTLHCANDHRFESWFQSGDAFDSLLRAGQLSCPDCGNGQIEKSLMSPQVRADRTGAREPVASDAETRIERKRRKILAALRRKIESTADYVGTDFTREARAIHVGDSPERAIYGEARPDQARGLIEEGISIAPLPFIPQRKTN